MKVLLSFLIAFAATLAVERFAIASRPRPPSLRTLPLRLFVLAALFGLWLAALGRPFLSGFATGATMAVLSAVSWRKRQLVGEPLVFSDLGLVRMIVRHPDLYYLERLGDPRVVTAAVAAAAGLAAWLWFEPPFPSVPVRAGLALFVALACLLAWRAARSGPLADRLATLLPVPDLVGDIARWGLSSALVLYGLRWRAEISRPVLSPLPALRSDGGDPRPDLVVVVQIESFLDPVRAGLSSIPLPGLARARAASRLFGPLDVPAHGAFTMRSEHAVMTGLAAGATFRGFDPYLSSTGSLPPTLATLLAEEGWRTLFIHPFRAHFFNRGRLMPPLGFAETVWEEDLAGAARTGPYVSDVAVADRILAEAARWPGRPTLIVAVTMENHGPWPPGRLPGETEPTSQYLRHLGGADLAISRLLDGLADRPGRALLCLYGDHPPILPLVDRAKPPQTDYVLLQLGRDAPPPCPKEQPLSVDALGRAVFTLAQGGREAAIGLPPRPGPAARVDASPSPWH